MEGGGAEKVLLNLLNNYDKNRFTIDLIVLAKTGELVDDIPSHVRTKYLSRNLLLLKLISIFRLSFIEKLLLAKQKVQKYDTIVSFYEGIAVRYHSYLLHNAENNVSWVHMDLLSNHYTSKYFTKKKEKNIYSRMNKILFVSNDSLEQFNKLYSIDVDKYVVYNPIDVDNIKCLAQDSKIHKRRFTICAIGRLHFQKDYQSMLKVARILKDKGYKFDLWILGAGKLYKELANIIQEYGLTDYVFLLGFKKNPYQYLVKSDIFLSTSISEGFSLVVAEALCLGIPVISTENTGPKELLEDGKYGILTTHNVEDISNTVISLMLDTNKLEKHKALSFERSKMFNLKNTINQISEHL